MSIIEWGVDFYTGLPTIDDQHRTLVSLANRLSDARNGTPQEMKSAFSALQAYVVEHFTLEEELMEESGVDAEHQRYHKHAHVLFAAKVAELWNAQAAGGEDTLEQMLAFLKTWILQHILHTDRQMAFKIHERLGADAPHNMFTHF